MNRLNNILNIVIGCFIGIFIGTSLYQVWDYKTHPNLYALTSAPWYTSILMSGALTAVVVIVAVIIKILINNKVK